MKALRQLGGGFLLGILSIGLVLGGFALAMAEGGLIPAIVTRPSPTAIPQSAYPTLELLPSLDGSSAPTVAEITPSITPTHTLPPPPTSCLPPAGWIALTVQPFDTLASLALTYRLDVASLKDANCLLSDELVGGSILYVPPLASNTQVACGAPAGWVTYIVKPGDTLYRISILYRVSIAQLQQANCLGASSAIYSGQRLRVPNVLVSTATFTPFVSPTATASQTLTPGLTVEITPSPTVSVTETSPPEITNTPTVEATVPPSATLPPTEPASPTPQPSPTP
jgi:LysM repeat protein